MGKKFFDEKGYFFKFSCFCIFVKGALLCQYLKYTFQIYHINVFSKAEQVLFLMLIKNVYSLGTNNDFQFFKAAIIDFLKC